MYVCMYVYMYACMYACMQQKMHDILFSFLFLRSIELQRPLSAVGYVPHVISDVPVKVDLFGDPAVPFGDPLESQAQVVNYPVRNGTHDFVIYI